MLEETFFTNSHFLLSESETRQKTLFGGAFFAEELSTVATMVATVGGSEFGVAAETNVRRIV